MLTTDDVVEALCISPGDMVFLKENFNPSALWGVGLVLANVEGVVSVMWSSSRVRRIGEHPCGQLIKVTGTALDCGDPLRPPVRIR